MRRVEFNLYGDWLNPNHGYLYGEIVDTATFESSPYTYYTIYLLSLGEGYGYHDGQYAVVVEWRQEGHPQYSNCDEVQVFKVLNNSEDAEKMFTSLIKEYQEKYPY